MCPTLFRCSLRFQITEQFSEFFSIVRSGGPASPVRVLLLPQPFYIWSTPSGHHVKSSIHKVLIQCIFACISFEMLYLCTDPGPHIRVRYSGNAPAGRSNASEIILRYSGITTVLQPSGLQHRLFKNDFSTDAFCIRFFQDDRSYKNHLWSLRHHLLMKLKDILLHVLHTAKSSVQEKRSYLP